MEERRNLNKFAFPDTLMVTPRPLTGNWELLRDFRCLGHTVPSGFCTDFASIPKLLRIFYETGGSYCYGAVLHDYLYASKERPRKEADDLFYQSMISCGVPRRRALAFWLAVRAFGWIAWKRNSIINR